MTVLVTGGAGYIGSHTVRRLRGRRPRGRRARHARARAPRRRPRRTLVVGDIADVDARRSAVHATRRRRRSSTSPPTRASASRWSTRRGTGATTSPAPVELVEAMSTAGVDDIVFSSSCSVYGTPAGVPVTRAHRSNRRASTPRPRRSSNGSSRWYGVSHGLRSVSLRYFNAAGASADGAYRRGLGPQSLNLVPLVMKATLGTATAAAGVRRRLPDARRHVHPRLHPRRRPRRRPCQGARPPRRRGAPTALNVGTGIGSSVMEVIAATERLTGRPVPYADRAPRRAGDPVAVFADPTRRASCSAGSPSTASTTSSPSAWEWHRTHPDGYRDAQ